jgi:hypothetical protein
VSGHTRAVESQRQMRTSPRMGPRKTHIFASTSNDDHARIDVRRRVTAQFVQSITDGHVPNSESHAILLTVSSSGTRETSNRTRNRPRHRAKIRAHRQVASVIPLASRSVKRESPICTAHGVGIQVGIEQRIEWHKYEWDGSRSATYAAQSCIGPNW